jgi:hypothetical protein
VLLIEEREILGLLLDMDGSGACRATWHLISLLPHYHFRYCWNQILTRRSSRSSSSVEDLLLRLQQCSFGLLAGSLYVLKGLQTGSLQLLHLFCCPCFLLPSILFTLSDLPPLQFFPFISVSFLLHGQVISFFLHLLNCVEIHIRGQHDGLHEINNWINAMSPWICLCCDCRESEKMCD